jgi:transposase
MSKSNRKDPQRAASSEARCTRFEWDALFPNDDACLEYLMVKLYPEGIYCPKCERVTKHHKDANRPSFQCQFCGHREHPMVGTIFEDSATSLKLWFDAIYLMASTRCGISAKQLEREIGVTYKTAWRMFNKIRSMLDQDDVTLSGTVEMDEAYIGGRARWKHKSKRRTMKQGRPHGPESQKVPVFGMVQRGASGAHGRVVAQIVPDVWEKDLMPHVQKRVLPASTVYTDNWRAYKSIDKAGYEHSRVAHEQEVYVTGDVHIQAIEGFWSLVKRGISGVYHGVSTKHLQAYLDEYAFRYNNRDATGLGMVGAFLGRIVRKVPSEPASE